MTKYGPAAFARGGKATAMLGDLLPGPEYAKLRRRVKFAVDYSVCEVFTNGTGDREFLINEAVHRLVESTDMFEETARETVTLLAEVLI